MPIAPVSTVFDHLLIFGVGLLGGSLALAAKKRGIARTVLGVGRSSASLREAVKRNVIDEACDFETVRNIDIAAGSVLAVFCTPVDIIPRQISALAASYPLDRFPNLLMTDVGSTKQTICRSAVDPRFLGSHPIAGSEKSGFVFADADLFEKRVTVITPRKTADVGRIKCLRGFWEAVGSRVVEMSPEKHDSMLALTSHLPHAVSAVLASLPNEAERDCTGTGFESMVRLAGGHPDIWTDILHENAENVLEAMARFRDRLAELTRILEEKDRDALCRFLKDSRQTITK